MSEQNQHNNWAQKNLAGSAEEMLQVPIPVIAPALVWTAQHRRMFMGERSSTDLFRDAKDAIGVGDKLK